MKRERHIQRWLTPGDELNAKGDEVTSGVTEMPHGKLEDKSSSDAHSCSGHSGHARCLTMDIICSVWVYVTNSSWALEKNLA